MYKNILFDLDGTLINSYKGISLSLRYAFDKCGINYDGDLEKFIGPPFSYSFPLFLGTDENTTKALITSYREFYAATGVYECTLMRGMKNFICFLKEHGKKIMLATTKPLIFAEKILKNKRIYGLFDFVAGSEPDRGIDDKSSVISVILESTGISTSETVLIGDTVYDVQGAEMQGIDCIGVTFGYGKEDELIKAGAVFTADSANKLENFFSTV